MIDFRCGSCRQAYRVLPKFAGRDMRCARCGASMKVPGEIPAAGKAESARAKTGNAPPAKAPRRSPAPKPAEHPDTGPTGNRGGGGDPPDSGPRPAASLPADIDRCFKGSLERIPVPWTYRIGLLLVTCAMVLLPILYLALVAGIGYLLYLYPGILPDLESRRVSRLEGMVYAIPLLVGPIALFFLIKPIFARAVRNAGSFPLDPRREPVFFRFIGAICEKIGAAEPRRIQVTVHPEASVSLRKGFLSLLGSDLVLTVGLPLLGALDARQLAGVIAHEFGHFNQGLGLRLSYIVRRVNHWLYRVVHERDVWDERIHRWSEESGLRLRLVLYLARSFIWCTRQVLWCFFLAGHLVSCYLLRQMERDADLHAIRLAGSKSFEASLLRIVRLDVASRAANSAWAEGLRQGQIAADIPGLIGKLYTEMPYQLKEEVKEALRRSKTEAFSTHPAVPARIEQARKEIRPGIVAIDSEARLLLRDFEGLCRQATINLYRGLGLKGLFQ